MPYMNTEQAANYFGVTARTIVNWCEGGAIECIRPGRRWFVWVPDEKERPASATAGGAGHSETVQSCTMKGILA